MPFYSAASSLPDSNEAINEICSSLAEHSYDFVCVFMSGLEAGSAEKVVKELQQRLAPSALLGCTCWGVIGSDAEIEKSPGISVIAAELPGARVTPFAIHQNELERMQSADDWYQMLDVYPNEKPVFVTIPDPFQLDLAKYLAGLNAAYPACPVLGGIASGAGRPGGNSLFVGEQVYDQGAVGVAVTGIETRIVVSQGCHPFGETFYITDAEHNVIKKLAGRPALEVLQEVVEAADSKVQSLVQQGLFVGLAPGEDDEQEYLVRGVVGLDHSNRSVAIADHIHSGQLVRFHVRDSSSAEEDLKQLLDPGRLALGEKQPTGALMFNCNGRGSHLFGQPDHDIGIFRQQLGELPAAGFFCGGEIGPVGSQNYLHSFTNSILLFCE